MKKILIIGLGNTVLSDDAVGPYVVRRAEQHLDDLKGFVDFKENYSGGIDMLYDMVDYEKVLLIDSIKTGNCEPGTCIEYKISDFDSLVQPRLTDSLGMNLPTVLELGRKCGYGMPDEFIILDIVAEDLITFSEHLTEKVSICIDNVILKIRETILNWINRDAKVEIM